MAAYDGRGGAGAFEAFIDDIEIDTAVIPELAAVSTDPGGGVYPAGTKVSIAVPQGFNARYSLDGTVPGDGSPRYTEPVTLDKQGLWDLRFVLEREDGTVCPCVFANCTTCADDSLSKALGRVSMSPSAHPLTMKTEMTGEGAGPTFRKGYEFSRQRTMRLRLTR